MTDPAKDSAMVMCPGCRCPFPVGGLHECPTHKFGPAPAPSTSRDDARDDALEEAARMADEYAEFKRRQHLNPTAYALREMATRLRSLKGQPTPADKEK